MRGPVSTYSWFPIRKTEGAEWIDTMNGGGSMEVVDMHIKKMKRHIPQWHAANPVQRIVRCVITEDLIGE